MSYNEYSYDGPVREFDTCINLRWKASTYAPSEKKARSNLVYRYKKEHGKSANANIKLTGKIVMVK